MESYEIQIGEPDSGKWKGTNVTFRKMNAKERAEVLETIRGNATLSKDGAISGKTQPELGQLKQVLFSIKEPKELKSENELWSLSAQDFVNLYEVVSVINPLDLKPTLLKE